MSKIDECKVDTQEGLGEVTLRKAIHRIPGTT